MPDSPRILFCNCAYAKIVPPEVKEGVLKSLCESGAAFDAVADLCEMSARRDPALKRLAEGGPVKIAACFPRAVKWLFAAAAAPLAKDSTEVLNMRVESAEAVSAALLSDELNPNLPEGKPRPADAPAAESEAEPQPATTEP
ncbi:MAG: hypothetical protein ACI9VS_000506 [Candidatus Binatia bacterium]|jgi:hypothetical protein